METTHDETPLQRAMREQGRKYAWLAAELDVSRQVLHRWAAGVERVPPLRRARIAALLGVAESELWPGEEE